jgi:hypothetical protein
MKTLKKKSKTKKVTTSPCHVVRMNGQVKIIFDSLHDAKRYAMTLGLTYAGVNIDIYSYPMVNP